MRRLLALLPLTIAVACLPISQPPITPTPAPKISRVRTTVLNSQTNQPVQGNRAWGDNPAAKANAQFIGGCPDHCGQVAWDVTRLDFNVCAALDGFDQQCAPAPSCVVTSDQQPGCIIKLTPRPPPFLNAGEAGALKLNGAQWTLATGLGWTWQGCSDFALFQKFIHGDDLNAILDSRVAHGCKLLRVFGQFVGTPNDPNDQGIGVNSGLGHFDPSAHADYYTQLAAFADLLAQHGLRLEFTALADNQILHTNAHAHISASYAALVGKWNVAALEECNEPFKNGCDETDRSLFPPAPRALALATGGTSIDWNHNATPFIFADYITWHGDRGDEWPRGPRGLGEIRDGASLFPGAHVAVIADEPIGAAEVDQPGRRSAVPDDFRFFGGLSKFFGAGATFHSDDGIGSVPFEPGQAASADAFFQGLNWAPWSAQFAAYQRGDPGSAEGIGNMPILHHDLNTGFPDAALRTFCKNADGFEWCIAVRPTPAWTAIPLRGCSIVEQPWKGFVKLQCPEAPHALRPAA